ncbi:MAG TPA: DedA family protein [Ferrovibrio sp.]|uniref:DedA family protein n=1 Tax=Ferrovibrio sp. TaxID=1917215 RepID=UPI002ED17201
METIAHLIDQFGYWAILAGTFLEGETILVLAGFAAHQGYLRLDLVILAAFIGSVSGDQLWFALSRHHGKRWLARRPGLAARFALATRWLERRPTLFLLGFRFLYGIRSVAPWAIGLSNVPARRFIILNVIAAAIWAASFGTIGYLFGAAVESMIGKLQQIEHRLLAAVVLGIVFVALARWIGQRLNRKVAGPPPAASGSDRDLEQDR